MMAYIVVEKTGEDYEYENTDIKRVYGTREKAIQYIKTKYPDFTYDNSKDIWFEESAIYYTKIAIVERRVR